MIFHPGVVAKVGSSSLLTRLSSRGCKHEVCKSAGMKAKKALSEANEKDAMDAAMSGAFSVLHFYDSRNRGQQDWCEVRHWAV
jgi:hypothetical protein